MDDPGQQAAPAPTVTAAEPSVLAGVRLVELGTLLAGPFAGRLLGDWGADVIKVEAPGRPDPLRQWGSQHYRGHSLLWSVQSRNKRCITLDLRTGPGQELFKELIKVSDVLCENFRPGTLEGWGLSYEELSTVNEGIILARVSGFGQTGPYASQAGYASVAEAMGGLRYINGYPDEAPPRMGISLGDSLAGMFAVQGILAALYQRDVLGDGRGQVIDVSLLESCFALLESSVPDFDRFGTVRGPFGTGLEGVAPSNIFRSADGSWLVIAANQDTVFARLCEAMGQPELATDERFADHFARGQHQDEIEKIVADWAAAHSASAIADMLRDAGVVCGPIYTIADIFEDEHFRARDMLIEHSDETLGAFTGPGIIPKFSRNPGRLRWTGPLRQGTHNEEIYCDLLGLSRTDLHALEQDGVV